MSKVVRSLQKVTIARNAALFDKIHLPDLFARTLQTPFSDNTGSMSTTALCRFFRYRLSPHKPVVALETTSRFLVSCNAAWKQSHQYLKLILCAQKTYSVRGDSRHTWKFRSPKVTRSPCSIEHLSPLKTIACSSPILLI